MVFKFSLLKTLGLTFLIFGIFLIIQQSIILTGSVIGFSLSSIAGFVGLIMIVLGILIFLKADSLEKRLVKESGDEPEEQEDPGLQDYIKKNTPPYLRNYKPFAFYNAVRGMGKIGLKTHGKEKLPEGPKLFIATHKKPWNEAFRLLGSVDETVHLYVDESINWTPLRRTFLKPMGMIPIKGTLSHLSEKQKQKVIEKHLLERRGFKEVIRDEKKAGYENIKYIRQMTSMLMQGRNAGIFVEGPELNIPKEDDKSEEPKRRAYAGYALVAREYKRRTGQDLPIVPVGIHRGNVAFGDAFYIDQKHKMNRKELEETATEKILEQYAIARSEKEVTYKKRKAA